MDRLLNQSALERARRDTWPPGWLKEWSRRALVAAIALAVAYWLDPLQGPAAFLGRLETAVIAALAYLGADLLFFPWNLMWAGIRQRDELRNYVGTVENAQSDFAELSGSAEFVSGDMRRIAVRNEGTRTVSGLRIEIPEANWISPSGWKDGEEVIPLLKAGEEGSIGFMASNFIGMKRESVRACIKGTCSSGESVEVEVLLDPHQVG